MKKFRTIIGAVFSHMLESDGAPYWNPQKEQS